MKCTYINCIDLLTQPSIITCPCGDMNWVVQLFTIQKSVFKAAFKITNIKLYTTLFFYETGLLDARQIYVWTVLIYTRYRNHEELVLHRFLHDCRTRNRVNAGHQLPKVVKFINVVTLTILQTQYSGTLHLRFETYNARYTATKNKESACQSEIGLGVAKLSYSVDMSKNMDFTDISCRLSHYCSVLLFTISAANFHKDKLLLNYSQCF